LKFLPALSNSITPVASAYFRNVNGGRMSLVAVGVDSGSHNGGKNTKGSIALQGGMVDMLVDQIWLGRNRTNQGGQTVSGAFLFDWGKVNASTVIVGDMQYTNAALISGFLSVGTNGTMTITNYLELGHTPTDPATGANPVRSWLQAEVRWWPTRLTPVCSQPTPPSKSIRWDPLWSATRLARPRTVCPY
jgi:hypothetical protein